MFCVINVFIGYTIALKLCLSVIVTKKILTLSLMLIIDAKAFLFRSACFVSAFGNSGFRLSLWHSQRGFYGIKKAV